jgi:hypothetical protein
VLKVNGFFSAGAGETDANEKERTEVGFSSTGAVLGRGSDENSVAEVVSRSARQSQALLLDIASASLPSNVRH